VENIKFDVAIVFSTGKFNITGSKSMEEANSNFENVDKILKDYIVHA
jgi:TATA-box binding protein (TBP) (component of TFIID and TFIIIB)